MMNYLWTEESYRKNELVLKYEPIQPFLFLHAADLANVKLVIDVGACVGLYSILMSELKCVEKIYSFEAVASTYAVLKKNIYFNDLAEKIECHNIAISDHHTNITFLIESNLSGRNSVKSTSIHSEAQFSQHETIEANSLDNIIKINGTRIAIKIDVEGHEMNVINGAESLLINNECILQIECFDVNKEAVENRLRNIGYNLFFEIGSDRYFSNIPEFRRANKVVDALKDACNTIVKYSLGQMLRSWLSVRAVLYDNKICAACIDVDQGFVDPLEYAFYLNVDGKRECVYWYQDANTIEIDIPKNIAPERITVTGFVREKLEPEKKAMATAHVIAIDLKTETKQSSGGLSE